MRSLRGALGQCSSRTLLFISQTNSRAEVYLDGTEAVSAVLWPGDRKLVWVREGRYQYTVYMEGQVSYRGAFKIVSADKYELLIGADKAILKSP